MWDNTLMIFSSVGSPHARVQGGRAARTPFTSAPGLGTGLTPASPTSMSTSAPGLGSPPKRRSPAAHDAIGAAAAGQRRADLRLRPARQRLHVRAHIFVGTALAPAATSSPRLPRNCQHLHRDSAPHCPHLHWDWALIPQSAGRLQHTMPWGCNIYHGGKALRSCRAAHAQPPPGISDPTTVGQRTSPAAAHAQHSPAKAQP